ncbi:MAG TPA: TIGR01777 family oxidoreductase [Acidimicrobiales bacterium]|nr:TIGR01777 family oxidoreductase [Acidimicrobiales bacterium]
MRIGVTGSSGLIGSAFLQAAHERGDLIIRFVRPGADTPEGGVIRWNPATNDVDDADLRRTGGLDAVVNLAGAGIADRRWSRARRSEITSSRIKSTSLLANVIGALPSGCPMVVSGSAIGYYGSRGNEVLDEDSTPGTDFLADVCSQWEHAAQPLTKHGTVVAYLRTGIVMSSRGGALKKQLPLFRFGLGGRLSTGRQWLSPISLYDEVRAILWAIDHRLEGPINVTAPTPLTNADFTKALARKVHRPARAPVPTLALQLALGRPLALEAVLASQRVIPRRLIDSGFAFEHPNISDILDWTLDQER